VLAILFALLCPALYDKKCGKERQEIFLRKRFLFVARHVVPLFVKKRGTEEKNAIPTATITIYAIQFHENDNEVNKKFSARFFFD